MHVCNATSLPDQSNACAISISVLTSPRSEQNPRKRLKPSEISLPPNLTLPHPPSSPRCVPSTPHLIAPSKTCSAHPLLNPQLSVLFPKPQSLLPFARSCNSGIVFGGLAFCARFGDRTSLRRHLPLVVSGAVDRGTLEGGEGGVRLVGSLREKRRMRRRRGSF